MEVYTAIYGERYDRPKDVHGLGVPALLYTDQPEVAEAGRCAGWDVRLEYLPRLGSPMMRAKWWKLHPELAAPDAEASVWIDGSIRPLPGFVGRCGAALSDHEDGLDVALTPHPWRDCIYDELEASVGLPKYEAGPMRAQVEHYRLAGHPPRWGLFASGAIARRHTPAVRFLDESWWAEIVRWHWQDQLSLPVVLRNEGRVRWAANMRWAEPWWTYTDHGVWG